MTRLILFCLVLAPAGLALAPPARAQALVDAAQDRRCEAQWRALNRPGSAEGVDRAGFLKTCMADVNGSAALPGPRLTLHALAGATGVCGDGGYTAAVTRAQACLGRGGLKRWIAGPP